MAEPGLTPFANEVGTRRMIANARWNRIIER
jgi:hypothetical protein